jgi:hypothetical protein
MLPDYDRAARIGDFWVDPKTRTFGELLMDLEESPHARAVVLGMLREEELRGGPDSSSSLTRSPLRCAPRRLRSA